MNILTAHLFCFLSFFNVILVLKKIMKPLLTHNWEMCISAKPTQQVKWGDYINEKRIFMDKEENDYFQHLYFHSWVIFTYCTFMECAGGRRGFSMHSAFDCRVAVAVGLVHTTTSSLFLLKVLC